MGRSLPRLKEIVLRDENRSRGLHPPGEESEGGNSTGVWPASLPAMEGKGWGEPKNPVEPRFESGPGGSGHILFASFGGADLIIGKLHRLVA